MAEFFSVAAVNLSRYSVAWRARCVVHKGLCMTVRAWFQVDGLVVVNGVLRVEGK